MIDRPTKGLLALFLLMFSSPSQAAPCCAGGASGSSLITGDEERKVTLSAGRSSVIADAPASGLPVYRSSERNETSLIYQLSGATLLTDRFQAGASLSLQTHEQSKKSLTSRASGLGDASLTAAFEAWPEWTYSDWKPRGYAFSSLIVPTGKSVYDSNASLASDVTGQGYASLSIGSALVKRWSEWDASFVPELAFGFSRRFEDENGLEIHPGPRLKLSLSVGRVFGSLRIGASLAPDFRAPSTSRTDDSPAISKSASSLRWDAGVDVTWLARDDWAFSLNYLDQTLVGPTKNTTLARTFALAVSKRFSR